MARTKVKVKTNKREIRRLLRGEGDYSGVRKDLEDRGDRVAAAAGEGMEAETTVGRNRVRVSVRTATHEAVVAEATDRSLSRGLDAAR